MSGENTNNIFVKSWNSRKKRHVGLILSRHGEKIRKFHKPGVVIPGRNSQCIMSPKADMRTSKIQYSFTIDKT